MRMNSVRMLWGKGVRAGLYPLSDTEAYWFTTKNCPSVRSPGFYPTVAASETTLSVCSPGFYLTVAASETTLDILCWTPGKCPGQQPPACGSDIVLMSEGDAACFTCAAYKAQKGKPASATPALTSLYGKTNETTCPAGGAPQRPRGVQARLPGDCERLVLRDHWCH